MGDETKDASDADQPAEALAWNDMRLFGAGYLMVTIAGKVWIPAEAVSIDRGLAMEAERAAAPTRAPDGVPEGKVRHHEWLHPDAPYPRQCRFCLKTENELAAGRQEIGICGGLTAVLTNYTKPPVIR